MHWDYIIVGAGSAGCALANRLSAENKQTGKKHVLLLEAGERDNSIGIRVQGAAGYLNLSRFDWGYHSQSDSSRHQKKEAWFRGRVLGGTSSMNGTNYVRGSAADYDRWSDMGNEGWAAKDIMPLFKSIECCDKQRSGPIDPIRGQEGPLHVRKVKDCHPVTEAFIQACESAGITFNSDYNGRSQEGVSYAELTQRRGIRCSAADAFLKPVLHRKNLTLIMGACMHRLLFSGQQVIGVQYEKDGVVHEAMGTRVILCAGAINTPKLLMLSGIGDAKELTALGITMVLDQPTVGKNLIEHPLLRLVYRVKKPTYNPTEGFLQKVGFLAKFLFKQQGPIASIVEAHAYLRTGLDKTAPDVQIHFLPFGYNRGNNKLIFEPYPSISVLVNKNHPLSRGQVRLASADPKVAPLIEPNLLESEEDIKTLVAGINLVRKIMAEAPIADWVVEEIYPGENCADTKALEEYIRANTELAYHPAGTCRMGIDKEAVLTPDLHVRGIKNLWVADASIMPDLVSGNINGPCMMFGEKLGRILNEID